MARHKDYDWNLPEGSVTADGTRHGWDSIKISLLMDIRDELKALNRTLGCYRLARMSNDINKIDKRLAKSVKLR